MTVRIGFLGGGFIAHHHGKMLHVSGADHVISAVHDPDVAKAAKFAAASGATMVDSPDDVFAQADAVYVCTWTSAHRALVEEAAGRGLPVFCEKPLAFDLADALTMVDAVERAGVVNQVGLVLRDSPSFALLRALVGDECSGRVMSVVFRDDQYIPIQGQYESTWRGDPSRVGAGTLLEHSIHDLDLLEWLFGEIVVVAGRSAGFHGIPGIEDVVVAQAEFASGALGSLTSVWHDVLARPSGRRMEVLCERGFYELGGDLFGPVRWTRGTGDGGPEDPGNGAGVLEGTDLVADLVARGCQMRNPDGAFVQAVIDGTPASPCFADALRPHLLADAIYASADAAGAPVPVPPGRPT